MLLAVADTHAVVWYIYEDPRLSALARTAIENAAQQGNQIGVSAITFAEIVYLTEKGRVQPGVFARLTAAMDTARAVFIEIAFDRTIAAVMPSVNRDQVPDMPDRIIAATARRYEIPVISRDGAIRLSNVDTIW